eukprot:COSAG02_NODE_211_length_28730_cov_5.599490_14_plen_39_part_00
MTGIRERDTARLGGLAFDISDIVTCMSDVHHKHESNEA